MPVHTTTEEVPSVRSRLWGMDDAPQSEAIEWRPPVRIKTERIALYGFIALVTYVILRSVFEAASRPFWFDEILTWAISRQPHLGDIWRMLSRAADGQPPMFYYVERYLGHLVPNEHIAFRLPSLVAFCATLVCVFAWVRKHSGGFAALVCVTAILISPLYDPYAVEARPYTLVSACIAFALVCYERADKRLWVVLLGFSLAFAQSLHYYAIFPVASFGIAEFVYAVRMRKIRWGVWAAITFALVPLAICWPLLRNFKNYYGQHFWSKPNPWALFVTYYMMARPYIPAFLKYVSREILTGAIIVASLGVAILLGLRSARARTDSEPAFNLLAAVSALIALPFTLFLATTAAHGGFTERYTLPTVIGMSIALGYIFRTRRTVSLTIVAALFVGCLAEAEATFWKSQQGTVWQVKSDTDQIQRIVAEAGHAELPVVVSDSRDTLPLSYYAPAAWQRYIVLLDPLHANIFANSDSNDLELFVMRDILTIQTSSFDDFVATHRTFLLYSSSSGNNSSDWWPVFLTSQGYSVTPLRSLGAKSVFLVNLDRNAVAGK